MSFSPTPTLIGDGWPTAPDERDRAVKAQERLVSAICEIEEQVELWELDHYAEERQRLSERAKQP